MKLYWGPGQVIRLQTGTVTVVRVWGRFAVLEVRRAEIGLRANEMIPWSWVQ
jgi:hypothetical protein